MAVFLVFLGGGLGAVLRHAVNRLCLAWFGPGFPVGTLAVNIAGSFLLGLLAALFAAHGQGQQSLRLFLATGLLGGFTTFSGFSLDAVLMWQRGAWGELGFYVAASVGLSIAALFVGLAAGRWIA
jgi:fluoride exporter